MSDPISTLSFIWQVSKDLYLYYQAVSRCDDDIKEFRSQVLWLQQVSEAVIAALRGDKIPSESKALVNAAVQRCGGAAKDLDDALKNIEHHDPHAQKAAEKLKALGRRLVYPFKKSTIASLVENTDACREELQTVLTLIGVQIGAKNEESLREFDEKLVKGLASLESALDDLKLRLPGDQAGAIEHQTKLILNEADKGRAVRLVNSLQDSVFLNRRQEIPDAHDVTLEWLKRSRDQASSQINDLLRFLEADTGLFWVQGRPAVGKSVLMKFLVEHRPDSALDTLWNWPENGKVIVASHFFWIAGSPIQKSRHGLAQSLLYEVLLSDLTLVPRSCRRRWKDRGAGSIWSIQELWETLHAAIDESDASFYFFIDGLDECQPESEHGKLAAEINKLNSSSKVKVIVSSRPWEIFQDNLLHHNRCLTMETSNHGAIVNSIRDRLQYLSRGIPLADQVAWGCLYRSPDCYHIHPEIHGIARDIVMRAEGVFLWVSIVMDSICKHIEASRPVQALRKCLDAFPKRLEQYFREMVFDRIHESLISETAMALMIALRGGEKLVYFSLLRECTNSGDSALAESDFVSRIPYQAINAQEAKLLSIDTIEFVSACCRDLLCKKKPWQDDLRKVTMGFTHRTIVDFLSTPEMEALLSAHVPSHFESGFLMIQLEIAQWKFVPHREGRLNKPGECWWSLARTLKAAHSIQTSTLAHEARWPSRAINKALSQLAHDVEDIALYYFNNWPFSDQPHVADTNAHEPGALQVLCCELARLRAYRLTERILQINPEYLCTTARRETDLPMLHALGVRSPEDFSVPRGGVDCKLLDLLLKAGADPNIRINTFELPRASIRALRSEREHERLRDSGIDKVGREQWTPWRAFLDRLETNERHRSTLNFGAETNLHLDRWISSMGTSVMETQNTRSIEENGRYHETFSTPHIQAAIKSMLEHNAELEYTNADFQFTRQGEDPVIILRRWLAEEHLIYDWPLLLGASALQEIPGAPIDVDGRKRMNEFRRKSSSTTDLGSLLSPLSRGVI